MKRLIVMGLTALISISITSCEEKQKQNKQITKPLSPQVKKLNSTDSVTTAMDMALKAYSFSTKAETLALDWHYNGNKKARKQARMYLDSVDKYRKLSDKWTDEKYKKK